MAYRSVNDMYVDTTVGTMGVLLAETTGASKVAVTVVTQSGSTTSTDVTARLQGSNDAATWHDLSVSATNVGVPGVAQLTADLKGYAWVQLLLARAGGAVKTLISATLNTGL